MGFKEYGFGASSVKASLLIFMISLGLSIGLAELSSDKYVD